MKIYTVTMYRYGDQERHSYVLGVFDKKHAALKAAETEKEWRGGNKYYPLVQEWAINQAEQSKTILALPDQHPFIAKRFAEHEKRRKAECKA